MKRTLLIAAALAATVIVTALPAQAKFEHSTVVISGPRGPGAPFATLTPIRLTGDGSMSWVEGSKLVEGGFGAPASAQRLGPAFPVLVYLNCSEAHRGVMALRQTFYPYAAGGPTIDTAPGQSVCGWFRTPGGWGSITTTSSLFDTLVSGGLPRTMAAHVPPAAAARTVGSASGPGVGAGLAAVAALILLSVGVFAAQRRRHRLAAPA